MILCRPVVGIWVTSLSVFSFFFFVVIELNNALGWEVLHTVLLVYKVVSRNSFYMVVLRSVANILFLQNQSR